MLGVFKIEINIDKQENFTKVNDKIYFKNEFLSFLQKKHFAVSLKKGLMEWFQFFSDIENIVSQNHKTNEILCGQFSFSWAPLGGCVGAWHKIPIVEFALN